jgi:hypothetical protein
MIDDPLPQDWKELQEGVRRLLRNIGLSAEVEVDLTTPRGNVNVDVFAVDGRSVDKISYVVECKNWGSAIPKHVVHSFTTVMHETGVNIGFIISKYGLQSGAEQYTHSTNITGLTYLEFQQRYFKAWWMRYFCPRIGDAADRLLQYTEPCNGYRDQRYAELGAAGKAQFDLLRAEHGGAAMLFSMFNYHILNPILRPGALLDEPPDLETFKDVLKKITPNVQWHCSTFRELLEIILQFISDAEAEFNALFRECIFEITPISGVGPDGPPLVDY